MATAAAAAMALLRAYPEISVSFLCFLFFYLYYRVLQRSNLPVNWPVAGMLPGLLFHLRHIHDWATDVLRQTGCSFSFWGPWFLDMNIFITCDPADLQHIFSTNFSNYPKGEEFLENFDILGEGIFNADGELWKKQRMRAHGLISDRRFRAFVANSCRDKVEKGLVPLLAEIARRGTVVDLQDVFLRLTFDMTFYLVFGNDPLSLSIGFPTIPFARAMDDAMSAIFIRHALPPAWWKCTRRLGFAEEKKLAAAGRVIDGFIAESVAEKKKLKGLKSCGDAGDEQRGDLLSSYINDDVDEEEKSHKFLRDTAVNFMLAGRDTTGSALAWFFWLLSENPEAEFKVVEELKSVITQKERSSSEEFVAFDTEEVIKLVYLHAALCEALRLFPPVPFEHKAPLQGEVLPSGQRVERGTKIFVMLYSMARMEGIWGKDCMEFRPERWISEKGRVRYEPSYKFLSFNSGPRTCLGKEVAFAQMKTTAAAMVYNFQVEVVAGHVVEPKLSIILQMKNGLKVRMKKRAHA